MAGCALCINCIEVSDTPPSAPWIPGHPPSPSWLPRGRSLRRQARGRRPPVKGKDRLKLHQMKAWRTLHRGLSVGRRLRLACLDLGTADLKWWAPEVLAKYPGGFYEMHRTMWARTGEAMGVEVEVAKYEPRLGSYPDVSNYDGLVLTGCANSANDHEPWLGELRSRIKVWNETQTKLTGFSFGPQIIAAALGGTVEKNPRGTELSIVSVELTDEFRNKFSHNRLSYLIHVHHNDHVLTLPPGAKSIGGTPVTPIAGFYLDDHVLCFAGHPEYSMDPWVLDRLLQAEMRDHLVATQHVLHGQATLFKRTDWLWQNQLTLQFFSGAFDATD